MCCTKPSVLVSFMFEDTLHHSKCHLLFFAVFLFDFQLGLRLQPALFASPECCPEGSFLMTLSARLESNLLYRASLACTLEFHLFHLSDTA